MDMKQPMQLRPYQQAAKDAVYDHLRTRDDNPCVVIPTGGGKTPVMASICKDAVGQWQGRVLVLAHVKELLEQTAEKLSAICPEVQYGVYSASLKRHDKRDSVIVAGIQSVYQRAYEFDPFDLVIVDEAHLIPPNGDGMYRQFLAEAKLVNPLVRTIGFTATAFRLKTGEICTPDGVLNHVCYEVGVRELIVQGYLCPLVTKAGLARADLRGVRVQAGEFVSGELESVMDEDSLVRAACAEVVSYTANRRNACLIFASGVAHGRHIADVLRASHGVDCGFVCGETPIGERDAILARFKAGELKYLCNVNVLTTGFDAPNIDAVAILRPTLSPGLYYQMVGRGFRLHPSKRDCLVLDFGENVTRHGPVDALKIKERKARKSSDAPAKECPDCHSLIAAGYSVCPDCGHEFPPPEQTKHAPSASNDGILSGQVTIETFPVQGVRYSVHMKRNAPIDSPRTLRVDYQTSLNTWQSEWICVEHEGYAKGKAKVWWRDRCADPMPTSAALAVKYADAGRLASPTEITVRTVAGEKYDRIVAYKLDAIPQCAEPPPVEDSFTCPECGCNEVRIGPGTGPHAAKRTCEDCGYFIRWIPKSEYARMCDFDVKAMEAGNVEVPW